MTPEQPLTTLVASLAEDLPLMRADVVFQAERAERRTHLPPINALIASWVNGERTLAEFKYAFQKGATGPWRKLGVGGTSGAMILNQLVANGVAHDANIEELLRDVLRDASGDGERLKRLRRLVDASKALVDGGVVQKGKLPWGRIPRFISLLWTFADPLNWPADWPSIRKPLQQQGVIGKPDPADPVGAYHDLVSRVRELSKGLGATLEETQDLFFWMEKVWSPPAIATSPLLAGATDNRTWLIGTGGSGRWWDAFRTESVIGIGMHESLGDLMEYESEEALTLELESARGPGAAAPHMEVRACWEFSRVMEPGDLVFAKSGKNQLLGRGVVTGDYEYDATRTDFRHLRRVEWQWTEGAVVQRNLVLKTLTDISTYEEQLEHLLSLAPIAGPDDVEMDEPEKDKVDTKYELEHAEADLFLAPKEIEELLELVRVRKNVILTGPPGVGKTYVAQRLAWLLRGRKAETDVSLQAVVVVQFHQAYSYEDFVQGWRPSEDGKFVMRAGKFVELCQLARTPVDDKYVMIIDEINRGNLSKIMGEMLMLIESDKRDESWALSLAAGGDAMSTEKRFYVPDTVHLIGTMNTADRSLAPIDYALRRRFAFYELPCAIEQPKFRTFLLDALGLPASVADGLVRQVGLVNKTIRTDRDLGDGFVLGHSYFCNGGKPVSDPQKWFERVVKYEIAPTLREYWYEHAKKADEAIALLTWEAVNA